jgi:NDP-sugar pyrophosphorylase family protein
MNGDILTTLDYGEFIQAHTQSGAALTIATHKKEVSLALGVIESEEGTVTDYIEKPTLNYDVSMGIYAYSPVALEHIPRSRFDFPDLVLALLGAGERVETFRFDGPWYDIGTQDEYELAVDAYENGPGLFEGE